MVVGCGTGSDAQLSSPQTTWSAITKQRSHPPRVHRTIHGCCTDVPRHHRPRPRQSRRPAPRRRRRYHEHARNVDARPLRPIPASQSGAPGLSPVHGTRAAASRGPKGRGIEGSRARSMWLGLTTSASGKRRFTVVVLKWCLAIAWIVVMRVWRARACASGKDKLAATVGGSGRGAPAFGGHSLGPAG